MIVPLNTTRVDLVTVEHGEQRYVARLRAWTPERGWHEVAREKRPTPASARSLKPIGSIPFPVEPIHALEAYVLVHTKGETP